MRFTLAIALTLCTTSAAMAQQNFTVLEHFVSPFPPNAYGEPSDGIIKMDGNYCVGYNPAHPTLFNENAFTRFTTGGHTSFTLNTPSNATATAQCGATKGWYGAEWATPQGWLGNGASAPAPYGKSKYGYGYYEVRMTPTCVQGLATSFFWIQAPNYGPLELDIEFPNDPGHQFNDVHWTIHPSGQSVDFKLGFNPCQTAHQYGFLWQPGQVTFTVDGKAKYTMTHSSLVSNATGFVMGNASIGIPNWGGGPNGTPNQQPSTTKYLWWGYVAGATSVPAF